MQFNSGIANSSNDTGARVSNSFVADQAQTDQANIAVGVSAQRDLASNDFELIQRLHSNLETLSEMTERLGFMMREIQYLSR